MIQTPTEAFGQRMFERSAAQILDNVGFHSATEPVLEILGLLTKRYFEDLCKRIAIHKENAGHEEVTISDVTLGYKDQFIDLEELHTYVLQVGTFDTNVQVPEYPVNLKYDASTQGASEVARIQRAKEPVGVMSKSPKKIEIFSAPQKPILPNFAELSLVDMGFAEAGPQGPVLVPAEPLKSSKGRRRSSDTHKTPTKPKAPARTTKTAVKRSRTSPVYKTSGQACARPTKMISEPVISKTKEKSLKEVTTMDRFAEFTKRRKAEMLGSPKTRSKDSRNKKTEVVKKVEAKSSSKRRSRSHIDEATPEKRRSPRKEAIDTFMQIFGNARPDRLSENGVGTVQSRSTEVAMERKPGSHPAASEHDKIAPLKIRIPIQEYTKFLEESDGEDSRYSDESSKKKQKKHKKKIRENESCSDKEKRSRRKEEKGERKEAKRKRKMKRSAEMNNLDGTQNRGHYNGKKNDSRNADTAESGDFDDSIFKKPELPPWRQQPEFDDPFECFKVITSELDGLKLKLSLLPRESDESEDSS
ncbi:unnamed protein product [Bursaphelenchus xylophilus]|uniref:(pine wood nematode) hypothetical protein n=1 Tax=Bursaphelenchus xylophilus TaxID=6326 RepID=A0A1I7SV01_BURXY|nr:unnamed protein product [Bursaphelenchus xylophilus]CAG9100678.1 unnamed protein product [Bursaphelenchus xylophilus]